MKGVVWCLLLSLAAAENTEKVNRLGPVTVTTSLTPAAPVIGDEITLQIQVEAEAEVEVLMPEFGEALDRYTILDFVPRRRVLDDGKSVFTQRYTLQPDRSGDQSIPPILIEFVDHRPGKKPAPDDLDAYEILTDRIDFTVQSVLPDNAARELKPPLGELAPLENRAATWGWGIVGGLLGLGAAGLAAWWWHRRRRRIRRHTAYELARRRLDQLLARPVPRDEAAIDAFFVAISSIVRRYLEDRFDLRAPDLTTEEFLTLAGSASDLSSEHQALLRDFLRQADLVKFAGVQASDSDIRRSSELAIRFLEETRENSPLIEDPGENGAPASNAAAPTTENIAQYADRIGEDEHA